MERRIVRRKGSGTPESTSANIISEKPASRRYQNPWSSCSSVNGTSNSPDRSKVSAMYVQILSLVSSRSGWSVPQYHSGMEPETGWSKTCPIHSRSSFELLARWLAMWLTAPPYPTLTELGVGLHSSRPTFSTVVTPVIRFRFSEYLSADRSCQEGQWRPGSSQPTCHQSAIESLLGRSVYLCLGPHSWNKC